MINVRPKIGDQSPEPEDEQALQFLGRRGLEEPAQVSRSVDVILAALILAFTLPLLILVALAIKWESSGPVLDKQRCIGRGARRFEMLSFRTTQYEQPRLGWARETRVGEFLRYTRIEALPQLINVIRGEMSILRMNEYPPSFLR